MGTTNILKVFNIDLDLKMPISNHDIEIVEGDTNNYFAITLTDGGTSVNLTNSSVNVIFSHSGGTALQSSANASGGVSIQGNVVTIHLNTNSFRAGLVECELQIYGVDMFNVTTTAKFNFSCRHSLLSNNTITSDMSYSVLSELMAQGSDALSAANTALTAATSAKQTAQAIPRLYIAYCSQNPALVPLATISDTPSDYIGICQTTAVSAPTATSDYTWHKWRGDEVVAAQVNLVGHLVFTTESSKIIDAGSLNGLLDGVTSQIDNINNALERKALARDVTAIQTTLGDINTALGTIIGNAV